jgi:hypothetical protein
VRAISRYPRHRLYRRHRPFIDPQRRRKYRDQCSHYIVGRLAVDQPECRWDHHVRHQRGIVHVRWRCRYQGSGQGAWQHHYDWRHRTGNLTITGTGAVSQASGALIIKGATSLAAGAANDVTLNTAANNFATVAITSGNNVSLRDTNGIVLGASTVASSLTVKAGAAVTQTGCAGCSHADRVDPQHIRLSHHLDQCRQRCLPRSI